MEGGPITTVKDKQGGGFFFRFSLTGFEFGITSIYTRTIHAVDIGYIIYWDKWLHRGSRSQIQEYLSSRSYPKIIYFVRQRWRPWWEELSCETRVYENRLTIHSASEHNIMSCLWMSIIIRILMILYGAERLGRLCTNCLWKGLFVNNTIRVMIGVWNEMEKKLIVYVHFWLSRSAPNCNARNSTVDYFC